MGWADTQAPTQQGPGLTAPETLVVGTLTPFQPWGTSEPRIFKVWPLSLYPVASRKLGWLQSDADNHTWSPCSSSRETDSPAGTHAHARACTNTHTHTPHSLSHQGPVLHILSEQAVVIQGVFGFAGHAVYWPFVHLMFNSTEKHVQRLPYCVLGKQQAVRVPGADDKHEGGTGCRPQKAKGDLGRAGQGRAGQSPDPPWRGLPSASASLTLTKV